MRTSFSRKVRRYFFDIAHADALKMIKKIRYFFLIREKSDELAR